MQRKRATRKAIVNEETFIQPDPIKPPLTQRNYTPLLVVALLIVTFLLGMATMRIQQLDKSGLATAQPAQAQNSPSQNNNQQAPAADQKYTVNNGHFPIKGQDNAKVTIIEFADLRCPFCKQFFTDVEPQIVKDYVNTGKVKFAFRQFAFLGPFSVVAANAAECANEQNKFWEMHDYLYQNQPNESDTSMFTTDNLTQVAGTLGLDTDQFRSCLDGKKYQKNVDLDYSEGQKVGVSGTPTFFINGTQLVGAQPYDSFKTLIEQELKK